MVITTYRLGGAPSRKIACVHDLMRLSRQLNSDARRDSAGLVPPPAIAVFLSPTSHPL